jgi:hypothetical protein
MRQRARNSAAALQTNNGNGSVKSLQHDAIAGCSDGRMLNFVALALMAAEDCL